MARGDHNPSLQDEARFTFEKLRRRVSASLWRKAALFGVGYFLCAEAGSYLSAPDGTYISFWLPAGLTVAVLLSSPTRDWWGLLLAAFPANFLFDLLHDPKQNLALIFLFYCSNVIQSATGAWLVRKFVAERPTLATLKEFIGLTGFAVVLSTALGAVIGAETLVYFGLSKSFTQSWRVWWGSTAMAVLVLTPFILTWFSKASAGRNEFGRPKKIAEAVVLLLTLVTYEWFLLGLGHGIMSLNRTWAIPLLLWAGLRFGTRGATAVSLFLSLTFAFFTTQFAIGLNGVQISTSEYIFPLQAVLAMASLVALIPAIVVGERDRTLAELRESEERFRNLTQAAFEGIAISESGRILDMNDQGLKMFGYERGEMIGKKIVELVALESRAIVAEALRTGQESIYGHSLLRKDGSSFYAEAQAKMVHIGNRTLRMTALRDITERKAAERALRESEEKFSKAFRASPDGLAISELETGRYIEVNQGYCRLYGHRREEMLGHTSLELGIWDNPKDRTRLVDGLKTAGQVRDMEMRTRTRDGQLRIILLSAEPIELGGKQCLVSVLHDATDRIQAELALRESERRFRSYFDLAAVGFSITSSDRRILAVNDEYCRILGYSREELLQKTWTELTHPDDAAANEVQFDSALAGRIDAYTVDKRLIRKDGQAIYGTISARCVRRPDGSPDYFVSLLLDITEREQAILREQQARIEYTVQLIASQEAERARIAGELHDSLGQSLSIIKNRTQLALQTELAGDAYEQIQAINDTTTQAIAEVRQISRDLHPYQLTHLGLTRALGVLVDNAAEASGITFETKFDMVDDAFERDAATNLYRIVQESVNNILKYSRARSARVTLERDVREVQLKIEDDGRGFEAGTERKGLGMQNIAERVRMLGGRQKVESKPGCGVRIEITIPISAELK